jgi:putative transposase
VGSRLWPNWRSALFIIKPETVIGWHRKAFKFYWAKKSKPRRRPTRSLATIVLIKQIHLENPLWSPERIHDQLINLKKNCRCACPKYDCQVSPSIRKSPSAKAQQSWKTFLSNHRSDIWSIDFFTVPTVFFKVLYVLIIVSHERRELNILLLQLTRLLLG